MIDWSKQYNIVFISIEHKSDSQIYKSSIKEVRDSCMSWGIIGGKWLLLISRMKK